MLLPFLLLPLLMLLVLLLILLLLFHLLLLLLSLLLLVFCAGSMVELAYEKEFPPSPVHYIFVFGLLV